MLLSPHYNNNYFYLCHMRSFDKACEMFADAFMAGSHNRMRIWYLEAQAAYANAIAYANK